MKAAVAGRAGRSAGTPAGASEPALSVVLVTQTGWGPVARTIRCLAAQTIAPEIELVLVTFAPEWLGATPDAVRALHSLRVVEVPGSRAVAAGNAAGMRAASAPVVALGEDHSYWAPDCGERLLARHAEGYAVVGPVLHNATPRSRVAWTDYVLGYGMFAEGHPGGDVAVAPGHNSAYNRTVIQRHADDLERLLAAEWVFHGILRAEGERLCVEPRAVTRHVCFGQLWPATQTTFFGGWSGAATRATAWPRWRRVLYTAGSPLLPALRLYRYATGLTPAQRRAIPLARIAPLLLAGLVVDMAGQAVGFLRPSTHAARDADYELDRLRFVSGSDLRDLP